MNQAVNFTQLLLSHSGGKKNLEKELTPMIWQELHSLASRYMKGEVDSHTLQPTALINEAYIKLVVGDVSYQDRRHFFALAARQMRHILVDHARAKNASKRGVEFDQVEFEENIIGQDNHATSTDILTLDKLLNAFKTIDERGARLLELRLFCGLTNEEIAEYEAISTSTVEREFRAAKAWLQLQIQQDASPH
ncbi:ECF-type sigma factor [Glaciecola sp. 1036]|uniref:ECF-type sigma factor n=1 Tax=Alteromonadaceae TaxID=72275 RepID=UPI003CFBD338